MRHGWLWSQTAVSARFVGVAIRILERPHMCFLSTLLSSAVVVAVVSVLVLSTTVLLQQGDGCQ